MNDVYLFSTTQSMNAIDKMQTKELLIYECEIWSMTMKIVDHMIASMAFEHDVLVPG